MANVHAHLPTSIDAGDLAQAGRLLSAVSGHHQVLAQQKVPRQARRRRLAAHHQERAAHGCWRVRVPPQWTGRHRRRPGSHHPRSVGGRWRLGVGGTLRASLSGTFLTLRASLSGTFLQTLPDLVTPLKGHSLSPRSCPPTRSAPSERFGY